MASRSTRKTWETAFLLSASMSSSYQETFDRAQEILRELGADNVNLGDEAEKAAQRQANAFQLAASAVLESGLMEALEGIKGAYTDIIETTMEFEYTMSAVEALSDAGSENVAKLEEKARTLGETTVFTAQQSSEAMTYMAQAGWDTVEMLEGMDGVISLAAASGTDLAEASSIVADTLAGFGMEASETARLSDVLAKTASDTNTNVSMMGEAFSNSAAIAGALGFEIEDVSVMLGLMANAGIKGGKAGTSLRNIFNGLAKDVTLTAEAFGEVDVSMFDENGNPKGLVEAVKELRYYFDQMKENEKIANAREIATMRGFNGLLAIINATDEQFEELYENISNAEGAAKKMADTRLDNLKGDVTLLKSAFESLKITIGEELTPAGRDLVEWLTEATQHISQIIKNNPQIITDIVSITAGVAGGVAALKTVLGILKAISAIKLIKDVLVGGPAIIAGLAAITASVGIFVWMLAREKSAVKELADEHDRIEQEYADATGAIDDQYGSIQNYLAILEELSSKEQRSETDKQKLLAVVKKLNEAVPELGIEYDKYTDKLNMSADAVKNLARAEYLRKMQTERMQKMEELAGLSIEQESAMMDLETEIGEKKIRQDEIESELAKLRESRSTWEYLNPFSSKNKREDQLVEERADLAMEITGLSNNLKKLEEEQRSTEKEYNELANEYVQKENQFNYFWDRATEQTPEIDRDLQEEAEEAAEEAAGQKEIRERIQNLEEVLDALDEDDKDRAVFEKMLEEAKAELAYEEEAAGRGEIQDTLDEAGMDYNDLKAGMKNAMNGTSMTSEDVSDQYGGAYEEAEGAEAVVQNGDMNITVNVNVEGNMTEETLPEVERVAEEAAEKVITYLGRHGSQRTRLGYN